MFFSAFSNWVIILPTCTEYHIVWTNPPSPKKRKDEVFFSNKYQLPCEIRFDSNVNALFGQVLSILCMCVCVWLQWRYICSEDQNHEPCWQLATSAARNKTRNKCFMNKHTQVSHIFWLPVCCQQLRPITSAFCTFSFYSNTFLKKKKKISHSNFRLEKNKSDLPLILVPQKDFGLWPWPVRMVQMYSVNYVNKRNGK